MGIDGGQQLEIRGAPAILDKLEASGLIFDGDAAIAERFFGPDKVHISRCDPRHLIVGYEFRNQPVYGYLEQLLWAHPTLWLKNKFHTENGHCGVWIARMQKGVPAIQKVEWQELGIEELVYEEDFSRAY
jgi:hypothetical protein